MLEYKFVFNYLLVSALRKMFSNFGTGFGEIANLALTKSEWTNFQKLRYWGLIEKDAASPKGGEWRITALGLSFLNGDCSINDKVVMYRNVVVKFEGKDRFIGEIKERKVKTRLEYLADANGVANALVHK